MDRRTGESLKQESQTMSNKMGDMRSSPQHAMRKGFGTRRAFLRDVALGLAALGGRQLLGPFAAAASGRDERRPNILFILTDDQGWPTLGCYGNKLVPTPHLDSLAREGMKFTDAYVMPQCTPTRAALLTGQHTARNGLWHVLGWYGYPWARVREPAFAETLPRETFTVAKGLKAAGYATACLGKWHLSTTGDGNYVGLKPEAAHYFGFDYAPAPPSPRYHQEGDKGVNWLTDQAIGFIERHRDQPWFIYLAHHTIHGPVVAPQETVAKYLAQGAPESGLHNATYLAALETLDQSVGRLLRRLDELKLRDNTLVVFLSDNGGVYESYDPKPFTQGSGAVERLEVGKREFSNAPLRAGKGSPYEGGIRVPCLVRWPGVVKSGSVCHVPVHVVDWSEGTAPAKVYPNDINGAIAEGLKELKDWEVVKGKVFYFQPGHETNPVFFDPNVRKIMCNAVQWAAPK
jgi:arylsulfatase A